MFVGFAKVNGFLSNTMFTSRYQVSQSLLDNLNSFFCSTIKVVFVCHCMFNVLESYDGEIHSSIIVAENERTKDKED